MEEIAAFFAAHPPFNQLDQADLARLAAQAQIEYFAAGHDILSHGGAPAEFLYVLRKGAVDLLRDQDGEVVVYDTLGPGEAFGYPSLIRGQPPIVTVRTQTETLAYLVPAELFHQLRAAHPGFASFFAASAIERLDYAMQARGRAAAPALFQTRLGDLVRRPALTIAATASVRQAAELMHAEAVSCLIVEPPADRPAQFGIITDRDLRNRVLAAGRPDSTPVGEVMSAPAISLPADTMVFEGLLLMLERRIHHLPISAGGNLIGVITRTDILRQQSRSPIFLPRQLERARDMADLRRYCDQVADTVDALLDADMRVSDIGRVVAVAHDALVQRLLRDAEAELGPPPAPYAWLVLGSEGRYEQTLRTDQDNALAYADDAPPEAPAYFAALAERVVQNLVECGFPRCPGDIMASNPRWRQPIGAWQSDFGHWISVPDEEALLRTAIFFDFRQVHGELGAEAALRPVVAGARSSPIFLARLARAALRQAPPINLLRQVTLERHGQQRGTIDLKLRGTAMVVDLARLFALEAGVASTSTVSRLRESWPASSLGQEEAERLEAAFELIGRLRLRHQRDQLGRGEEPSNHIVFDALTPLERRELKESFQAIAAVQRGVAMGFQTDRLV